MPKVTKIDVSYPISHPYLYAWDCMMGSYDYWKNNQQERARGTNAPIDAIYWSTSDRKWATFGEITNEITRERIRVAVEAMGHPVPPKHENNCFWVTMHGSGGELDRVATRDLEQARITLLRIIGETPLSDGDHFEVAAGWSEQFDT